MSARPVSARRVHLATDRAVERLALRYKAAYEEYNDLVDQNAELRLTGGRPSRQARDDEELAFEALESAGHALAAALEPPTIH